MEQVDSRIHADAVPIRGGQLSPAYAGKVIELGSRTRKLPAPPSIVWGSLVDPDQPRARKWLHLLADEVKPKILEATEPVLVVWSSLWPSRPRDRIRLELSLVGTETALKFTLLTPDEPPDSSELRRLGHRIGQILFADLRYSYGQ
jgi:hypothetical protein